MIANRKMLGREVVVDHHRPRFPANAHLQPGSIDETVNVREQGVAFLAGDTLDP